MAGKKMLTSMCIRGIWIGWHGGRDSVISMGMVHLVVNVAHAAVNDAVDNVAARCMKGFVALVHVVWLRGRAKQKIEVSLSHPCALYFDSSQCNGAYSQ